jgi:hypothetical protein
MPLLTDEEIVALRRSIAEAPHDRRYDLTPLRTRADRLLHRSRAARRLG